MPWIERNSQVRKRFARPCCRQRFRWPPKSRHRLALGVLRRKSEREEFLRAAIHHKPGSLLVYFDQVGSESVSAVNAMNQPAEFIVGDCFLILLQHAPLRFAAEDAGVVGGLKSREKAQEQKCRSQ